MKQTTLSSLFVGATLLLASGTLCLNATEMKCGAGKCGAAMTQERTQQMTQKQDGTGQGSQERKGNSDFGHAQKEAKGNSAFGHAQKEAHSKGKGMNKNKGNAMGKGKH